MDNNNEILNYYKYDKKNYSIKDILLKKLNLDDIKIVKLEDIAELSELFSMKIPFANFELVEGNYSFDIETVVECIERKGGRCLHLNIAFGLLLIELGIEVQPIKAIEDSPNKLYDIFKYHYANAFKWNDGKYYFHDQGLGYFNQFYPIEIGNEIPINGYSKSLPPCLYKVIKNKDSGVDNSFILQKQLIDVDFDYKSVFEFKLHEDITCKNIIERSCSFNDSQYSIPIASILRKEGYYFYANDSITIYLPNSKKEIIKITNNQQLEILLLKYLNLDIKDFKCFKNVNKIDLSKDAYNIIYKN